MDGLVGWAFGGERRPGGPRVAFFMVFGALGLDAVSFHSWKNSGGGVSQVSVLEHELSTGAEIRGAAAAV